MIYCSDSNVSMNVCMLPQDRIIHNCLHQLLVWNSAAEDLLMCLRGCVCVCVCK